MSELHKNFTVVILAAGEGRRMQSPLPKVLHHLSGKPLIEYIVSSVEQCHFVEKIIVVVSAKHTLVQEYLGTRVECVIQKEQKGTADAVLAAKDKISSISETVVVLNGDIPFISSESIFRLAQKHIQEKNKITLFTTTVKNFLNEQNMFLNFGRILRDENGGFLGIREYKDADSCERGIMELNSGQYCFDKEWLFEHIPILKNENAQKEFYLTDLIALAKIEKQNIGTAALAVKESFGVTTQDDLKILESFCRSIFDNL